MDVIGLWAEWDKAVFVLVYICSGKLSLPENGTGRECGSWKVFILPETLSLRHFTISEHLNLFGDTIFRRYECMNSMEHGMGAVTIDASRPLDP